MRSNEVQARGPHGGRRHSIAHFGWRAVIATAVLATPLAMIGAASAAVTPSISVTTSPGTAYAGAGFGQEPVVTITDPLFGTGGFVPVVVSLSVNDPMSASTATMTCPSVTVTAPSSPGGTTGTADFVGCSIDTAANGYTVTASANIDGMFVAADSASFDVSALPSFSLVFSQQPTTTTGGIAISPDPAVEFQTVVDMNTVTLDVTSQVSLSLVSGKGPNGATLNCPAQYAVGGVATFPNCVIKKAGTGYELEGSVTISGTQTTVDSSSFDVDVGPPAQVVFTQGPTSITAGDDFSPTISLSVEDAGGNVVSSGTGSTDSVYLLTYTGGATAPLACSGAGETEVTSGTTSYYSVTATAGVASFPDCTINVSSPTGSAYSLAAEATDNNGHAFGALSGNFYVTPGSVSQIVFTTEPAVTTSTGALAVEPVVTLEDHLNNVVDTVTSGSVDLAVTSGTGGSSAGLTCTGTDGAAATISHGVANFSSADCSVNPSSAAYTLTASYSTFTAVSSSFTVPSGGVASVSFITQPGAGTGGSLLSVQPVVGIYNGSGNLTSATVTLSLSGGVVGDALTCTSNSLTPATGVADFSGCSVNHPGTYQLVATVTGATGVTATSSEFTVTVGPLAQLVLSGAPTSALGGTDFSTALTVTYEDAGGNTVTTDTEPVTLAIAPGTGAPGADLSCGGSGAPVSASPTEGVATFANCQINLAGTNYQLLVTGPEVLAMTAPFNVSVGRAVALTFIDSPDGATVDNVFPIAPEVEAVDAGGNVVTGFSENVSLADSADDLSCATLSAAPAEGVATFDGCSVTATGTISLSASAAGLGTVTSPSFTVVAAAALGTGPVSEPVAQSFGNGSLGRNDTDLVDDVNTASGELDYATTDLTVAGLGVPLDLTRTYNSLDATGGLFGPGWSSVLDASITFNGAGTTATVRGPDGQRLVYTANGNGTWSPPPGSTSTLTCGGVTCTLRTNGGEVFTFTGGKITALRSLAGVGLTFVYANGRLTTIDVARSTKNLAVAVTEDAGGQITSLATPTRTVRYQYASSAAHALLTGFTDANGDQWTYVYGTYLDAVIAPSAVTVLAVSYNGDRVASAESYGETGAFDDSYSWDGATGTSTRLRAVLTPTGPAVATYVDQYSGGLLVSQTMPNGATTAYSYSGQLELVESQHADGSLWTYGYDGAGDLTSVTYPDASGTRVGTTYTYNASHEVTSETNGDGATTTYAYKNGELTSVTDPGQSTPTESFTYNALGERLTATTALGTTTYSYDAAGDVTGDVVRTPGGVALNGRGPVLSFNEAGQVTSSTTARGHLPSGLNPLYTTTYTYDADGHLLSITRGDGTVTENSYDQNGALTQSSTTFDPLGDQASSPDVVTVGSTTTTTNVHNTTTTTTSWNYATFTLTTTTRTSVTTIVTTQVGSNAPTTASTVTNSSPQTATTTDDSAGDELTSTDATGHTTTNSYNDDAQLASTTAPDGVTTTDGYDVLGRLTSTADAIGDQTSTTYDPSGLELSHTVDGATTTYTYDRAGLLLSETSPGGATTTYSYNGAGEATSATTASGTTTFAYNALGDLTKTTEPDGRSWEFVYNAADELTDTASNGQVTVAAYDADGDLATVTDPTGRSWTVTTSPSGHQTQVVASQTVDATTQTVTTTDTYNGAGQLIGATSPAGAESFTYDAAGNVSTATVGPGQTFIYQYPSPGVLKETYPDGTTVTSTYDDAGNVMTVSAPGVGAAYLRNTDRQVDALALANGQLTVDTDTASGLPATSATTCAGTTESTTATTYNDLGEPTSTNAVSGETATATSDSYGDDGTLTNAATSTAAATATVPATPCTTGTLSAPGANTTATALAYNPETDDGSGGPATVPAGPATAPPLTGAAAPTTLATPGGEGLTYDGDGNVTSYFGAAATVNDLDELTAVTGGPSATYGYDADGNETSSVVGGSAVAYTYNAADQLVAATDSPSINFVDYTYNAQGLVASRELWTNSTASTTDYIWDPVGATPRLALVEQNGTVIRRYFYGDGPIAMQTVSGNTTATYYLATDAEGDVTGVSNATGQEVAAINYSPFGAPTEVGPPPAPAGVSSESTSIDGGELEDVTVMWDQSTPTGSPVEGYTVTATNEGQSCSVTSPGACGGTCSTDASGTSCTIDNLNPSATYFLQVAAINEEGFSSANAVPTVDLLWRGELYDSFTGFVDTGQGWVDTATGRRLQPAAVTPAVAPLTSPYLATADAPTALTPTSPVAVAGFSVAGSPSAESALARVASAGVGVPALLAPTAATIAVAPYAAERTAVPTLPLTVVVGPAPSEPAVLTPPPSAQGPVTDGVVDASSPVATGYNNFLEELVRAGYTAEQLATVLVDDFNLGESAVVSELLYLGYDADGLAEALASVFDQSSEEVGATMINVGFTASQTANALVVAFS